MQIITENCATPYALIGFADGLPYAALGTYGDGGPATVAVDQWCVSTSSGHGIDGYRSSVARTAPGDLGKLGPHPELDGALFPTHEDARRAQYEAGVIAYFIRLDSPHYGKAMEAISSGHEA